MVCLQNGMTKCHFIMSEPIYQNWSPAKYSFFNDNKIIKILNALNSLDFVRAQTVNRF